MKKNKFLSKNGITLISLVITIIVIVILAAVAINIAIGNNGLISKTKDASNQMKKAQAKEEMESIILEKELELRTGNKEVNFQAFADKLCDDETGRIEYVETESKVASLEKITATDKIYVKLTGLYYEFEINNEIKVVNVKEISKDYNLIKVTDISLTSSTSEIMVGDSLTISATISPENASNQTLKWTSSDDTIATVENGVVTVLKTGNVTIKAKTKDGSNVEKELEIRVNHKPTNISSLSWETLGEIAKVISSDSNIKGCDNEKIAAGDSSGIGTEEVTVTVPGIENPITLGIGDYKTMTYNNISYNVRIIGFNSDILQGYSDDGQGNITYSSAYGGQSKYAGITFDFENCLGKAKMNSSDTNSGGWASSLMYSTNIVTYYNGLNTSNSGWSNQVKNIRKKYCEIYSSSSVTETNSNNIGDELWLLSCSEIWGKEDQVVSIDHYSGYSKGNEGEQYKYYYNKTKGLQVPIKSNNGTTDNLRKKFNGKNFDWWLRSSYYYYSRKGYFCTVYTSGSNNGREASYDYGVSPGFSI